MLLGLALGVGGGFGIFAGGLLAAAALWLTRTPYRAAQAVQQTGSIDGRDLAA